MLSCKSPFKLHASRHTFMYCLHLHSCRLFPSPYPPSLIVHLIIMMWSSASWLLLDFIISRWGLAIMLTWLSCHFILKLAPSLRQSSCQTALRLCVQPSDTYTHASTASISPWSPLISVSPDCMLHYDLPLLTSKHKQINKMQQSPKGSSIHLHQIPRVPCQ